LLRLLFRQPVQWSETEDRDSSVTQTTVIRMNIISNVETSSFTQLIISAVSAAIQREPVNCKRLVETKFNVVARYQGRPETT